MRSMFARVSTLALLAACGSVADGSSDAHVSGDGVGPTPSAYRGVLAMTAPVVFGGSPYCMYTITLKQIDLVIELAPSGDVLSGVAQNMNVEATVMPCPHQPAPLTVARYTLDAARSVPGGQMLTFRGDTTNRPKATLVVELSATGATYKGIATWTRIDQPSPLDWSVTAQLTMTLQPSM